MQTRRAVAVGMVVAVVILAVGAAYLLLPPRKTGDVAVPPNDAAPEQVVEAYLAALNAHDCATAEALSTSDASQWCHDLRSLTDITVHDGIREKPSWSGQPPSVEVVNVAVDFSVRWRLGHDDGSMPDGRNPWGYLLMRRSADQPWRIFSEGTG